MRLATLTKTQQSAPFAQAEQKQLASLSCSCALDAVIRNDSRLQWGAPAAQLDCSSKVSAPVPSDCVHGANGNCRWFKTAFRDSSRLFGYTAIFVFFFFPSSVSSDRTQPVRLRLKFGMTQTSPGVWLKTPIAFSAVYSLRVSVHQEVLERTTDLSDSGMFIVVGDLGYLKTLAPRMRTGCSAYGTTWKGC